MPKTSWIAVLILGVICAGLAALWIRRPSPGPQLDCPPERVHFRDGGEGPPIAYCGDDVAASVPAGAGLAVGLKLDLNKATDRELALIPGVGGHLATVIVRARDEAGGFLSWEQVDELPGVGAAKIELLRAHTHINGQ